MRSLSMFPATIQMDLWLKTERLCQQHLHMMTQCRLKRSFYLFTKRFTSPQSNIKETMQVRLNDVIVNDTPHFLTDTVTDHTHSLVIPMETDDLPYVIPLSLLGVTSYFPTRKPTIEEFESLPHICLTNADVPYDPADPMFAQQE